MIIKNSSWTFGCGVRTLAAMTSSSVAIVYHSGFGRTQSQPEAVRDGAAAVEDTTAHLIHVAEVDAHWDVLDEADAIIFGSPTYPWPARRHRSRRSSMPRRNGGTSSAGDKLAAGFTNSAGMNGDKLATLQQFALFAMQHGMVWVGLGLPNKSARSTTDISAEHDRSAPLECSGRSVAVPVIYERCGDNSTSTPAT